MDVANVTLPSDLEAFVAGKVTSGEYVTRSEVFREALVLLRERDKLRALRLEEFRKLVQVGVDQLDRRAWRLGMWKKRGPNCVNGLTRAVELAPWPESSDHPGAIRVSGFASGCWSRRPPT